MTELTALRAELDQALADLEHLRQLVSERRVNGDVLALGEYRVSGLRRRLAALEPDEPPSC